MTSLPITLPPGFSPTVKKGDKLKAKQVIAVKTQLIDDSTDDTGSEYILDLTSVFGESANSVRKYLAKGPGDSVAEGEIIASRLKSLGLKKERIVSQVSGTVVRFERDTGKLVIRTSESVTKPSSSQAPEEIVSPLAGVVSVCNNDTIVIETESKTLGGTDGIGGTAKGHILVIAPESSDKVTGTQITKDAIGKIMLLPDIEKEAIAKAAAIGIAGILGTNLSRDLFSYLVSKKVDLPVIAIDPAIGKTLAKTKDEVVIYGAQKTIALED